MMEDDLEHVRVASHSDSPLSEITISPADAAEMELQRMTHVDSDSNIELFEHVRVASHSDSPLLEIEISPAEAAEVKKQLQCMTHVDYDSNVELFEFQAADALRKTLPWVEAIMKEEIKNRPAIRIKGFDYDNVAPTSAKRCSDRTHIPYAVVAGFASLCGFKLVGYASEKIYTHPLFHDIRPVKGGAEGSNGAGEPLNHHMDMSYEHKRAPEVVALACLREGVDPDVKTPLVSNAKLYQRLQEKYPEDIKVLCNPLDFRVEMPLSTMGGFVDPMPLLSFDNGAPVFWLRVHHDRIKPQSDEAKAAFAHLQELLEELEDSSVHLCAGELLLVNNMRSLHRRTDFEASFNGTDRLLVRSYFKVHAPQSYELDDRSSPDTSISGRIFPEKIVARSRL